MMENSLVDRVFELRQEVLALSDEYETLKESDPKKAEIGYVLQIILADCRQMGFFIQEAVQKN